MNGKRRSSRQDNKSKTALLSYKLSLYKREQKKRKLILSYQIILIYSYFSFEAYRVSRMIDQEVRGLNLAGHWKMPSGNDWPESYPQISLFDDDQY